MKLTLKNAFTNQDVEISPSTFTHLKTSRIFSGIEFAFEDHHGGKQSFIFDFKSSKVLLKFLEENVSNLELTRVNKSLDL